MGVLVAALLGLLGLAVGSFLNVVIWRVPRGESVVAPPSACPRCHARIRARHNVPVVSWLVLRGRCYDCRAPISARYPAVEAATGLAFVVATVTVGLRPVLPAVLYLVAIGIALTLIDLDVHRLPDAIVLPSYPVLAVLLTVASAVDGDWWALGRAAIGMAALGTWYGLLHVVRPDGMGRGDVKLAGLLGLVLGWFGWGELVVGGFAAFLLGGLAGIGLMVVRRADRRSRMPFGPWMLLGAVVGLAWGGLLWRAYLDVFALSGT